MGKIKDIYKGEIIDIWEDGDAVYFAFPFCVVNFPKEDWEEVKKDIEKIAEL
jgi:ferredoxin-fold anticodon binding domain-containing protein